MPNQIGPSGLLLQTIDEIISEIKNGATDPTGASYPGMFSIYGADINVDANSPDGQMINIVAQAKLDVLEFLQAIYNSFDPDKAFGVSLDARCAINGVVRNPGTFTEQTVAVVVDRALTLPGLDTAPTAPFTVSDNNGNEYVLTATTVLSGAGSTDLPFRALLLGPVSSLPNAITRIVTVTLGVSSVNNAAGPDELGLSEETDFELRIRRAKSVSLPSKGFLDGLVAALIDTVGVTAARVYENDANATDGDGIPGHSIWCVVEGGENDAIGRAIYVKRNAGCGMKGTVSVTIDQVDGSTFEVKFDRPTAQNLWISFDVAALGSGSVDPDYVRAQLLELLSYDINQTADVTTIVALVRQIAPAAVVSSEGVSDDGATYASTVANSTIDRKWALAAARIIINGLPG